MTSPDKCPCLRHVLIAIANADPASLALSSNAPTKIRIVFANGHLAQSENADMPKMARELLSRVESFEDWEIAPLVNGDLSKATYRAKNPASFIRLLQLSLPKSKSAPMPPLECKSAKPRKALPGHDSEK